jgi:hypothetical protein
MLLNSILVFAGCRASAISTWAILSITMTDGIAALWPISSWKAPSNGIMAYLFGGDCWNSRLIIAFVGAAFGDRRTLVL